jgi:hypothetical protein
MATPTRPGDNVGDDVKDDPDTFPGWENMMGGEVGRRTLIKGAAWTAPVIALTMATPLAAASTVDTTDLSVSSLSSGAGYPFTVPPYATQSGNPPQPAYRDNQSVNHYLSISNVGTLDVPAGTTFTVTYPGYPNLQMFYNLSYVGAHSTSTTPGIGTSSVTPVGPATVSTSGAVSRTYVINVPIPAGTFATLAMGVRIYDRGPGAYVGMRITATVSLPAGLTDDNPANNSLAGPVFTITGS